MIAARYINGSGLQFVETDIPRIADDELLVRVEASSICGTDLKIVHGGHRKLQPGQTITLGHEFVGTIERAGSRVANYPPGLRVGVAPNIGCGACEMCGRGLMNMCPDYSAFGIDRDGSHTEFVRVPAAAIAQGSLIPLSETISLTEAALAEPLSCAVNGIRVSQLAPGDVVLIYGAGPMGLLNLMLALASGASSVLVVDLNTARLQAAIALGAGKVLNANDASVKQWVLDQTRGRGADVVITAAPAREAQAEALELLAPFGRLCLFAGLPRGEGNVELDTNAIHYKNLIVTGMTGGSPRDYRAALRLIEAKRVDVMRVVSHVFPLRDVRRAYEVALSGKCMKVLMAADKWMASSDGNGQLEKIGAGAASSSEPVAQAGWNP